MRFQMWLLTLVLCGFVLSHPVQADEPAEATAKPLDVAAETDFFESRIRPLFEKHCAECHSGKSKTLQGGLRLDHAEGVTAGGDAGAILVPGKPDESPLIEAVRYEDASLQMPPAGKLADKDINDLVKWVSRGAYFPKTVASTTGGKRVIDLAEGRKFWAFQPLKRTEPAAIAPVEGVSVNRVDAFLREAMAKQGLAPSQRADRRTLIRRAHFDLTGLPPTPEEIEAFVADADPEAYPKLVERLLQSPHYGERWARYWLDLARYCDVPESWAVTPAKASLYRDWVVTALNQDLPYDQFVVRQLAADQLPEFEPRDIAALGFLGLSPNQWKELKLAPDVIKSVVAEEWEERINTVSSAILGLTVACARCHDHKFDPILQQDYYGLAGVFASIRQVPLPMLPRDEARVVGDAHVQVKALEEDVQRFKTQANRVPDKAAEFTKMAEEAQAKIDLLKKTPNYDAPLVYAVEDAALTVSPDGENRTKLDYALGAGQDVALQVRGNPSKPGVVVPRHFLSVMSSAEPVKFTTGSGRLEFAQSLFREGAPLSARVMVNRVWKHHFGAGLVDTPSNFGIQGSRPTHPELLDDLAARFIDSGWSLKWLHRELMLSATYQQQFTPTAEQQRLDAANLYLSHMNRRRLEVEPWRDAMLAATGQLDLTVGGASQELGDANNVRRTLYGMVKRSDLDNLLRLYDFPDPTSHSPSRIDTTTPLQQLFVLNSDFLSRQGQALAARVRHDRPAEAGQDPALALRAQIQRAYTLLYGRLPTAREVELGVAFLTVDANAVEQLWQQYAEVLLASNELMFVE